LEVRLIDDQGEQLGIVKTFDALARAREKGLDLILISPGATPPVAKISDFGKFKYQQTKHEKEARKSQRASVLKEIKLSAKIGEHDLMVRVDHANEFLKKKYKIKVSLFFKGREVTHKEIGERVIQRLIDGVADLGMPEGIAKMEGRNLVLIVVPK